MSEKDSGYRHLLDPPALSSSPSPSMGRHQRFLPPELLTDLHLANLLPGMLTTDHVSGLDDLRRVAVHNHFLRNELALLHQLPVSGVSQQQLPGAGHSQHQLPVSSGYSQHQLPVSSGQSQHQLPVSSGYSQHQLPVSEQSQLGEWKDHRQRKNNTKGRFSARFKHLRSYSSPDFPKMSSSDYVNLTDCYECPQSDFQDKGNRSMPYIPSGHDKGNRSLPYIPSGHDAFPGYSVTHDVRYDISDDEDYNDATPEELDIDELLSEGLSEGHASEGHASEGHGEAPSEGHISDNPSLSPAPETLGRKDKYVTPTSRRRHVNATRQRKHSNECGTVEMYDFEDFSPSVVREDPGPQPYGLLQGRETGRHGMYGSYTALNESANGKEFVRSKTLSMIPVNQILVPHDTLEERDSSGGERDTPPPSRASSGSKLLSPDTLPGQGRYRSKSAERGRLIKTPSPFRRKKSTAWAADDEDETLYDPLTPASSDDSCMPLYYTTPPKQQMATTPNSDDGRSRLDRSSSTKGGLSRLARRLSQKERRNTAVDRKKALRQRSVSLDCLQDDGGGGDGRRSLMSLPADPHTPGERCRSIPTSPSLPTKLSKTSGASSPNLPGRLSRRASASKVRKEGKKLTSEVLAFFDAVEHQDLDAAKGLLEMNGLDLNCVNSDDLTPLDVAIMTNHVPMARMILAHGGKENPKFHRSNESRALRLISLVKEAGKKVDELSALVKNGNAGNANVSSSQQKENERALSRQEFRHKLLKRMKSGYEHSREPSEPTNVTLSVASSTTLLVGFDEPEFHNDAVVTRYKVQWSCFEDFSVIAGEKILDDVRNMNYEIPHLVQGNMYYVRIQACNMKGFGPAALTNPPYAVPSSWREVDSLKPRPEGRLKLMDTLFANIKNSRPADASAIKDGLTPAGSPIHPRRSNMRKSLKNLFASAPKFQKTVKRGVYLAALLYSEDRVVVTNDEVLPLLEVDENFALSNLHVDFHWLMKIACTWEDVKSLRQDMDKLSNSSSVLFRSRLLNTVAQLQSALGTQDLGQFFYKPVRDSNGSIILVTVNYIRDPKVINTTHVKWMPFSKVQKRVTGCPEDMATPELMFSLISEMMLYNQVNTLPVQKGLYLGYLKLKSSVDLIRIMVPERTPNVLPNVRIRECSNVSKEEWEWIRNLDNNDVTGPPSAAQANFHKQLMAASEHLLESIGINEDEAISHRLYDLEVIELSEDVSFILLLPAIEGVCSIPGHSEEIMEQPGFITLPVQVFEMIHMCTYQYDLISRYSRLSSILEMDTYLAQQAQREAFSSEEIAETKERVEQLSRFQQRLDEVWKGLRWTMDIIQYARDKSVRGGLPLGVLFAPPPSPNDSPNLDRRDVSSENTTSSSCSDMGYHSDRSSVDQNMDLSDVAAQRGDSCDMGSDVGPGESVWARHPALRGVLRVYAAYDTGLARGTSVKLHVTPRTTSREVIHLVVQQLNKALLTKGRAEPLYTDEQLEDFCLVAVIGARERVLRDDYQPLQLQNPWTKGRLFVRLKTNLLAALEQGHVTSV